MFSREWRGSVDVVIPCHNAATTVAGAVSSALSQAACRRVIVVDDGSKDDTRSIIIRIAELNPTRVLALSSTDNRGPARARNCGVRESDSGLVAFLDADDVYEHQALDAPAIALQELKEFSLVRLSLKPAGAEIPYAAHPDFGRAWRTLEMTVAGNIVIRREILDQAGGFPEDPVFRQFGGEDGALSLGLAATCRVGTLFDQPGVLYAYRPRAHAEQLFRSVLFGENPPGLLAALPRADAIRRSIEERLRKLDVPTRGSPGIAPVLVQWG
ncbi:glycosyltransferase family A protein [Bradyrhizobium sp. WD16]|uniref:glycosyltransferase family A protein n=1 Tax=Bradyrhizobium sp. WD16 TaxID=1521768 RepID=UPI0020A255EB|nr:glycosyltransferase family A protein [Bradyrhizobium sp. WD16]UTD29496.1 glycosyltransferase [Bradyrhizobium sp. WD16]